MLWDLNQEASQDEAIPQHIAERLNDATRYVGTGGFAGVHQTQMQDWWGQDERYTQEQFQNIAGDYYWDGHQYRRPGPSNN